MKHFNGLALIVTLFAASSLSGATATGMEPVAHMETFTVVSTTAVSGGAL